MHAMDPSPLSKTSNPKRLSLVLQSGAAADAEILSNITVSTEDHMPHIGDDNSLPVDPDPPTQTSPTIRSQRSPSAGTSALSSLLGLKTTSRASEVHVPPQETRFRAAKIRLPKKPRGLSRVLNASGSVSSGLDVENVNVPPELAAVKEPPNPPTSSTRKHARRASISATAQIQRVKDMVLPRPRHESGRSTSSMLRNSLSSSSPSLRSPANLAQPPATSTSPGPEQSIALDSISGIEDPTSTTPAMSDTVESPKATAKQMRRMSFDFASLKQPRGSSPTSPGFPPGTGMQRSQSLWTHKVSAGRKLAESADKLGNLQEPMSERQRALNVKRARKMTQVFGTEPPSSLFQITNLDDVSITPVEESMQDSLANILSLPPLPPSSLRSRSSSRTSFVVTDDHEDNKTDVPKSDQPPSIRRSESGQLSPEPPTLSFTTRRRRAAKLARFFGVGYHDLSESMWLPITASIAPPPSEVAELRPSPPVTPALPPSPMAVDVKMSGPARFWGMMDGRRSMKDANMDDVIGRLREMKAR